MRGGKVVDRVEALAVERAVALFGVEHANVQPYSGSPANLAVHLAFLAPGDTVLGISLAAGGHLTHGHGLSVTADVAHIASSSPAAPTLARGHTTTTHKTLRGPGGAMIMSTAEHAPALDRAVFPGLQGGPHDHTTAAIAVALHEGAQPGFH